MINRNNAKQTPIPVVSSRMQLVNPDGTPTRSGQLLLEQLQPNFVNYGAAGGADMADMPDGAFYVVRTANGEVLYQFQDGEWHYVAGTMWGTLSPDQRPTTLGVNDAGFEFRSIDTDPQYGGRWFIWSQTAWIEVTPVRYGTHAARLAAPVAAMWAGMLWVETDRNNIVYQVENISGTFTWVYVTGAMTGTIIAADQRPAGLGTNDKGLLYIATDATSCQWNGSAWRPVGTLIDAGAAPQSSQFRIKANGLGGFSALCYAPDNVQLGFDVELDLAGVGNWKALNATGFTLTKTSARCSINRFSGATVGAGIGMVEAFGIDLATGNAQFAQQVNIVNTGLQVNGQAVVGVRRAAITAPTGGTTIDAQARTAINAIIAALSASGGGHGLIG